MRQEILIAQKIMGPTGTFLFVLRGAEGQLTNGLGNSSSWPLSNERFVTIYAHSG